MLLRVDESISEEREMRILVQSRTRHVPQQEPDAEPAASTESTGGLAVHPSALGPPAKLAVHTDDVIAFFDHFHQHPDEPDLIYDVQPPG
jgi:hypothetical protein